MEIPVKDIDIAHRLCEIKQNVKRPIIVKFRYRDTPWDVMKYRKLLKGMEIIFSADLYWKMLQLFREVRTSAWRKPAGLGMEKSRPKTRLAKSSQSDMARSGAISLKSLLPLNP